MWDEPRLRRKPTTSSARPRRLSEVDIRDSAKPIPDASSFFIFPKDNRLGTVADRRFRLDVFLSASSFCFFISLTSVSSISCEKTLTSLEFFCFSIYAFTLINFNTFSYFVFVTVFNLFSHF